MRVLIALFLGIVAQVAVGEPMGGKAENSTAVLFKEALQTANGVEDEYSRQAHIAEAARLAVRLKDPVRALEIARGLGKWTRAEIDGKCLALEAQSGDIREILAKVDALPDDAYRRPAYVAIAEASIHRGQGKVFLQHLAQCKDTYTQIASRIAIARVQAAGGQTKEAKDTLSAAIAAGGSKLWYFPDLCNEIALAYAKMRAYDGAVALLGQPDSEHAQAWTLVAWAAVWNSDIGVATWIADAMGPGWGQDQIHFYLVEWLRRSGKTLDGVDLAKSIASISLRDRCWIAIAREYATEGRSKEAMEIIGRISNIGSAIGACGQCASACQLPGEHSKDAAEYLDRAKAIMRDAPAADRFTALLCLASCFATVGDVDASIHAALQLPSAGYRGSALRDTAYKDVLRNGEGRIKFWLDWMQNREPQVRMRICLGILEAIADRQ